MRAARLITVGTGGAMLLGSLAVAATTASATSGDADHGSKGRTVRAELDPLNNSGVTGAARVTVEGKKLRVKYHATGLLAGMPHAAHIHYGAEARHECPTVADDTNKDHRLNVAEGLPEYGPIAVSLTTRGDTSPKSALAIDRFSTAPHGKINYLRYTTAPRAVARAIARGEGVLVIHGIDYNHNGRYDLQGAGPSELDPSGKTPAEATDPAACGVLLPMGHDHD
jgi:hypothetical protein